MKTLLALISTLILSNAQGELNINLSELVEICGQGEVLEDRIILHTEYNNSYQSRGAHLLRSHSDIFNSTESYLQTFEDFNFLQTRIYTCLEGHYPLNANWLPQQTNLAGRDFTSFIITNITLRAGTFYSELN